MTQATGLPISLSCRRAINLLNHFSSASALSTNRLGCASELSSWYLIEVGMLLESISFSLGGSVAVDADPGAAATAGLTSPASAHFLTSLLDLNVCCTKESLSMASISFTRFTCATRVPESSSLRLLAASSFLSLAFNASSALAAASRTSCSLALACSAGGRCSNPALMFADSPRLMPCDSLSLVFSFSLFSFSLPRRRSRSRERLRVLL